MLRFRLLPPPDPSSCVRTSREGADSNRTLPSRGMPLAPPISRRNRIHGVRPDVPDGTNGASVRPLSRGTVTVGVALGIDA
jgi:hypothetical protein